MIQYKRIARKDFRAIFFLTVLLFFLVTKGWYVLPEDAPHSIMKGFPFPYECSGWHTSMSFQIFWLPLIIDFIIYFLFTTILFFLSKRIFRLDISKRVTMFLFVITSPILAFNIYVFFQDTNVHSFNLDFEYDVIKSEALLFFNRMKRI